MTSPVPTGELALDVAAAVAGDRAALERVVRSIQPVVARLALRFFGCPEHAQDATQEALVQVVTRLDRFEGRSSFMTWVYRVASNKFLSMARSPAERAAGTFEQFDEDLAATPETAPGAEGPQQELALAEIRIGCTLAMLLCLEREARMAFILGAIVELDHGTAAEILGCSAATYRKRLERSRQQVTGLLQRRCGVFEDGNPCQCSRRTEVATQRGHLVPGRWLFATSSEQVRRFPEVLVQIRKLAAMQRTAALYQAHPEPVMRDELAAALRELLGDGAPPADAAV